MQQAQNQKTSKMIGHSSHMSKRPPRLSAMTGTPAQPHMHAEQHPSEDEITEWGSWVSSEGQHVDPIDVPQQMKKPGFVYQWITVSCVGSEDKIIKRRASVFFRSGWKPVPGIRGKGYFFLEGEEVPATIEIGGLLLVEKPKHIEEHARKLNEQAAKGQLQDKLQEVSGAAPSNVRHKLVNLHADANPVGVQTLPPNSSAVPD